MLHQMNLKITAKQQKFKLAPSSPNCYIFAVEFSKYLEICPIFSLDNWKISLIRNFPLRTLAFSDYNSKHVLLRTINIST